MSTTSRDGAASVAEPRRVAPVAGLGTLSLAVVVVGGVYMASYFPGPPPLALPLALLALAAVLLACAVVLMARQRGFAWPAFSLVARWAFLAYAISAAMIEFAFVRNHASGAPLVVVSLMLVVYAVDVPVIIAFTVARYQSADHA